MPDVEEVADATLTERIAVISDVHGNLTALEAVLTHVSMQGISRIFNLGDLVGKGPRSAEAVDRCREVCEVTVLGNWDDMNSPLAEPYYPVVDWHRRQLGAERLDYLTRLPGVHEFVLSGQNVRLFHASQIGVYNRVRQTAPREVHRAMFENTDFTGYGPIPSIVGCGDIHQPYAMSFEGRTLFNVGSVGNPLDVPLACYAVLTGVIGSPEPAPWSIETIRVPYDIENEIAVAEASGMPHLDHYASELRTAKYRGLTSSAA